MKEKRFSKRDALLLAFVIMMGGLIVGSLPVTASSSNDELPFKVFLPVIMGEGRGRGVNDPDSQPSLIFPFEVGQTWYVTQGYETSGSHSPYGLCVGYQRYSFDLMDVRDKDIEGDAHTRGQKVLAPASGTIVWREDGNHSITIRTGQRADGRYQCVMVSHHDLVPELDPIPVGRWINQGDQIGTAACNGPLCVGQPAHIHMTYFTTADDSCQGGSMCLGRVGEPFQNLERLNWPAGGTGEHTDKLVWRGMDFSEPGVYVCEDANFQGKCHRFTETTLDLADLGDTFCNDCASSIYISGNYWALLWQNAYAGGKAYSYWGGWQRGFGPQGNAMGWPSYETNLSNIAPEFNDQVSSIFVWEKPPDSSLEYGAYVCPDINFSNIASGEPNDPTRCIHFGVNGDEKCSVHDVSDWPNKPSSLWFLGNFEALVTSGSTLTSPASYDIFDSSRADLREAEEGHHAFNDDIATIEVIDLTQNPSRQAYPSLPICPDEVILVQNSDLAVGQNPALGGSDNTFTFEVKNLGGKTAQITEIFVQGKLPDGGIWKAWAATPDVPGCGARTFQATAPMWADKPGVWTIEKIVYKDGEGGFFNLLANGHVQTQSFRVVGEGVTLFRNINYKGVSELFTWNDPALATNPIGNDKVSSLFVFPGWHAILCSTQNFGGTCERFDNSDPDLRGNTIGNDTTSSLRVWQGDNYIPDPGVTLFRNVDYRGVSEAFTESDAALANNSIGNDRTSAIAVYPGWHALLCSTQNFGGDCERFSASDADLRDNSIGNDTASSLRVWQGDDSQGPTGGFVSFPNTADQSLDLTAQASDDNSGVSWVRLHVRPQGGTFERVYLTWNGSERVWEGPYPTSGFANGTVLECLLWAGDYAGNSRQMTGIRTSTVSHPDPCPWVAIYNPLNGMTIGAGTTVRIKAKATDPDGISHVQFGYKVPGGSWQWPGWDDDTRNAAGYYTWDFDPIVIPEANGVLIGARAWDRTGRKTLVWVKVNVVH